MPNNITRLQVSATVATSSGTSTSAPTVPSTPTVGNNLICCVCIEGGAITVSGITQTNVTWSLLNRFTNPGTNGKINIEFWIGTVNSAGAGTSATVTFTGALLVNSKTQSILIEYSGLTSTVSDVTASTGNSANAGLSFASGTTSSTAQAFELALGIIVGDDVGGSGNAGAFSAPTNGFSLLFQNLFNTGAGKNANSLLFGVVELLTTTVGAQNSALTSSFAYTVAAGAIVTLKGNSSGGSSVAIRRRVVAVFMT